MKNIAFTSVLIVLFTIGCQKKDGFNPYQNPMGGPKTNSSHRKSANPQGGEVTEGGGGSKQLEAYMLYNFYIEENAKESGDDSACPPTPRTLFVPYAMSMSDKEKEILSMAKSELNKLQNTVTSKYEADRIKEALRYIDEKQITFDWHVKLEDKFGVDAWARNNPFEKIIRLSYEMWLGDEGVGQRKELCDSFFIPFFHASQVFCVIQFDSIISAHEVLSLVNLETDGDFHLSAQQAPCPYRILRNDLLNMNSNYLKNIFTF